MKRLAGKQGARDAVARQWVMLSRIPRYPRKVTAGRLRSDLVGEGYEVTKRTIERDLRSLAARFPLVHDDRERPYGWSWHRDAPTLSLPGLSPAEALVFHLAERHLRAILPASIVTTLASHFRLAAGQVAATTRTRSWANKVRIVPASQPLIPPKVNPEAYASVTEALLSEHLLEASYRRRGDVQPRSYVLNPLALVQRGPASYLVAAVSEYADPLLFALHRFASVKILNKPAHKIDGFDIDVYVNSGALAFGGGGRAIRLEALIDPAIAEHLEETPLSLDQTLTVAGNNRVRLKATVTNTPQLLWWLRGFGNGVEVLSPKSLRRSMSECARDVARLYR